MSRTRHTRGRESSPPRNGPSSLPPVSKQHPASPHTHAGSARAKSTVRKSSQMWRGLRRGTATAWRHIGSCTAAAWHRCRRLIRIMRPALLLLLVVMLLAGILSMVVSQGMVHVTQDSLLSREALESLAEEQAFDCVLILGAGLRPDGTPSDMLRDRVLYGCDLYLTHPEGFGAILMSGDHTGDYNEVAAMKALAIDQGVDAHVIFLDHEGYSTYESISRAKDIYGVHRLLIVTQSYHLYRALYIAQALGLEAYGYAADSHAYAGQGKRDLREVLARYKDFFSAGRAASVSPDAPKVDLNGDGNLT